MLASHGSPLVRIGELEDFYGIHLDPDPSRSVAELLSERLGDRIAEGVEIYTGDVMLSVRKLEGGEIREVGIEIFVEERGSRTGQPEPDARRRRKFSGSAQPSSRAPRGMATRMSPRKSPGA